MTPDPDAVRIVVADDDLLFSSRISAALVRLGYRPTVARTAETFEAALRDAPRAVIVNLAARRFDALDAIRRLKRDQAMRGIRVLGFCGHRDVERAKAAKTAGCDAVTTNGMVAADLERVLGPLVGVTRPPGPA